MDKMPVGPFYAIWALAVTLAVVWFLARLVETIRGFIRRKRDRIMKLRVIRS